MEKSPLTKLIEADFTDLSVIEYAFTCMESNMEITQKGIITSVLPIDNVGLRHQRFLIKLANGQTLMIVQNIDLAPLIPNPQVGEELIFHGEYEWNEHGGVIHWTHHDPDGEHVSGWLEYQGKRYQ
jgi:hypothetical protein